jgi:hypothetical protein
MAEGWYYLHSNGDLIYKRDLDGTVGDIRESALARGLWPMNPGDRENAWRILIEALAAGANKIRVFELAKHWGCDDKDAQIYAGRSGCNLFMDGNMWCATGGNFVNLAESDAGFGPTGLEAMSELAIAFGYKPSKMWGATFQDLLDQHREVAQNG